MPASNATSRFTDRVENYVRYRPGYPQDAVHALKSECGLQPSHGIADIASGTGIWTRMLLENGNSVFGVEPNAEMWQAGEAFLAELHALELKVDWCGRTSRDAVNSALAQWMSALGRALCRAAIAFHHTARLVIDSLMQPGEDC